MKIRELKQAIRTPYFTTAQVAKIFSTNQDSYNFVKLQLKRFADRGEILRIRNGLYLFAEAEIDDFVLANLLYPQSYVSLESALNSYGIIPDIPAQITSITPITSKQFSISRGEFTYSKIATTLYFGFTLVQSAISQFQSQLQPQLYYRIAEPEKALLDFIYIRKVKNLEEFRVEISTIDHTKLRNYAHHFPKWVQKVIQNA